jgi:hypothetical protein
MIDITIVDDALPLSLANDLESMILNKGYPWYFLPDITHGDYIDRGDVTISGHEHNYFDIGHGGILSNNFGYVHSIPHIIFDKIGYKKGPQLIRAKSFMHLPLVKPKEYLHDNLHIDSDTPHIVCLYYVNDTDGDTFIYDIDKKLRRISPKKNRAVVFDGSLYHASSLPTKNKRIIININVAYDIVVD